MSDLEIVLLVWAAIATVLALQYRTEAHIARTVFMHFVRDEKARAKMLSDWDKHKKAHGA